MIQFTIPGKLCVVVDKKNPRVEVRFEEAMW